ncbi:MAG: aspartyl protease family protein [Solirubrobacteraceae bacterium]
MVLTCGSRSVDVAGIVDSGADGTLLPLALAPRLGLDPQRDLSASQRSAGADGTSFQTWRSRRPIGGQVFVPGATPRMFGVSFELTPAFAQGNTVLWGRADFFPHFKITFEQHAELGPIMHIDC